MMRAFDVRPMPYGKLKSLSRPGQAGGPEAVADILYDTQTYLDNATTDLTFFGQAQANVNLSNLPASGQLPAEQFFSIDHISLVAWPDAGFVTTAAGGVAGMIDDLGLLLYQGRPVITLQLNTKPYGPWPALAAGSSGVIDAMGWGTFTAEESLQVGQIGRGGLFLGQSIIIPPMVAWSITIKWAAAQNLTDDYRIRMELHGTRYRPIQ